MPRPRSRPSVRWPSGSAISCPRASMRSAERLEGERDAVGRPHKATTDSEIRRLATRAAAEIAAGRAAVEDWGSTKSGWKFLAPGLERTYKRGRARFSDVRRDPSPENVHEWRKRVKDLWYHLRLLRDSWPEVLGAVSDQAHELSDLLGDHHDLSVLAPGSARVALTWRVARGVGRDRGPDRGSPRGAPRSRRSHRRAPLRRSAEGLRRPSWRLLARLAVRLAVVVDQEAGHRLARCAASGRLQPPRRSSPSSGCATSGRTRQDHAGRLPRRGRGRRADVLEVDACRPCPRGGRGPSRAAR